MSHPDQSRISWPRVLGGSLAGYAVLAAGVVFAGIADRLMLFPSTDRLDASGASRHAVAWAGGELEVWQAASRGVDAEHPAEAFVLRFYGNADRAENWVAVEASALPFRAELWGVNYPGFGGSTGPASLRSVAASALAAYDALRARAGERPIFVFGTSMGTTAALHVAAERPVAGVYLHNPPALREIVLGDHGWWNLWLLALPVSRGVPSELDSIANARRAKAPAVFVLSEADEIVAHRHHLAVRDAYAGPKETFILKGARHNDEVPPATERAALQSLVRAIGR